MSIAANITISPIVRLQLCSFCVGLRLEVRRAVHAEDTWLADTPPPPSAPHLLWSFAICPSSLALLLTPVLHLYPLCPSPSPYTPSPLSHHTLTSELQSKRA